MATNVTLDLFSVSMGSVMKRIKIILTVIVFTLLSVSIFGFITQCSSRSDASGTNNDMALTYLGHFEFTVTKEVVYGNTPYGIRHDVHYEGPFTGDLVSGKMSGIDYMLYRPDGVDEVNTRATLETPEGAYISVQITGYAYEDGSIVDSYVRFMSGYEKYKWMNDTVFFGKGKALSEDIFEIDYYYYK